MATTKTPTRITRAAVQKWLDARESDWATIELNDVGRGIYRRSLGPAFSFQRVDNWRDAAERVGMIEVKTDA